MLVNLLLFSMPALQDPVVPRTSGVTPEIGMVLDGLATWDKESGAGTNLRMMELSVSSPIDPFGRAYAIVEFPGAEEVEVPEAAFVFSELPDNWEIRAGRLLVDFGKWNTVHLHDLPTIHDDPVRAGLLGGRLTGTGLELHRWFGAGDVPMRFSLGFFSDFGAHGHSADSHEDHGDHGDHGGGLVSGTSEAAGLRDWGFSGRITAQHDWGSNGWFQWGLSGFTTPQGLASSYEDGAGDDQTAYGLSSKTFGADLTFRRASVDSSKWTMGSLEYWSHSADQAHFDGSLEIERPGLNGLWGVLEQGTSSAWSRGIHGGVWEVFEEDENELAGMVGIHLNRHLSEFQRLRFGIDYGKDDPEEEKTWTVAIQWSSFLGAHRHGMDW